MNNIQINDMIGDIVDCINNVDILHAYNNINRLINQIQINLYEVIDKSNSENLISSIEELNNLLLTIKTDLETGWDYEKLGNNIKKIGEKYFEIIEQVKSKK